MKINTEKLKREIIVGVCAFIFVLALYFASDALVAFAAVPEKVDVSAVSYTPLAPLPLGKGGESLGTYTLSSYLSGMLKLIIALGGAVSILMAIVGGVQFVASGIAPNAKNEAKGRITNAFIGLAIILSSYLLLNTINPDLVNLKFSLEKVEGTRQKLAPKKNPEIPIYAGLSIQKSDKCAPACGPGYICTTFMTTDGEITEPSCEPSKNASCGPDLTPLTGDAALMEGNMPVVWTSPDKNVQSNLDKLKQETDKFIKHVESKKGKVTVNSVYRPLAYQAHLYEVVKKWEYIKDNANPDCATLKEKIRKEKQKHGLGSVVSSPDGCAPHVKGTGIDLSIGNFSEGYNFVLEKQKIDLRWQALKDDEWHFNLINYPFAGCAK